MLGMKLITYLEKNSIEPPAFAKKLKVSGEAVRLWLCGERIPNRECMKAIFKTTDGKVEPNDFYEFV